MNKHQVGVDLALSFKSPEALTAVENARQSLCPSHELRALFLNISSLTPVVACSMRL